MTHKYRNLRDKVTKARIYDPKTDRAFLDLSYSLGELIAAECESRGLDRTSAAILIEKKAGRKQLIDEKDKEGNESGHETYAPLIAQSNAYYRILSLQQQPSNLSLRIICKTLDIFGYKLIAVKK